MRGPPAECLDALDLNVEHQSGRAAVGEDLDVAVDPVLGVLAVLVRRPVVRQRGRECPSGRCREVVLSGTAGDVSHDDHWSRRH